ncbi:MAG: citrulline utilization hydrolase CtlX [Sediminibacterium sp.]|jgi:hypothetical protein|nr:amidinotransferase [Sediminibacterium sp.]MBX9781537.1 amidinotransferase [Chitinophagaceae bacterium]
MQHSNHLLMIKPVRFDFNAETAVNNSFQTNVQDTLAQEKAAAEFTQFISVLRSHGIDVTVVEDTPDPHTPDSIFPNNWISFHTNGTVCLYPMYAKNRRLERKPTVLKAIEEKFIIQKTIDFTYYEQDDIFLEGTGSMVLDRENKIAYACLSPRTHEKVLSDFCTQLGYSPVVFWALDAEGQPIYHTNVMMCVADKYVVICLDSIRNEIERSSVTASITATKKAIIEISLDQMNHFAGNMLQVHNKDNEPFLVMSSQAYQSLHADQIDMIQQFNPIIHSDITTIETNGGGSARCMMAEVFLTVK